MRRQRAWVPLPVDDLGGHVGVRLTGVMQSLTAMTTSETTMPMMPTTEQALTSSTLRTCDGQPPPHKPGQHMEHMHREMQSPVSILL